MLLELLDAGEQVEHECDAGVVHGKIGVQTHDGVHAGGDGTGEPQPAAGVDVGGDQPQLDELPQRIRVDTCGRRGRRQVGPGDTDGQVM